MLSSALVLSTTAEVWAVVVSRGGVRVCGYPSAHHLRALPENSIASVPQQPGRWLCFTAVSGQAGSDVQHSLPQKSLLLVNAGIHCMR